MRSHGFSLHGAHFDVRSGVLATMDADGRFSPAGPPLLVA